MNEDNALTRKEKIEQYKDYAKQTEHTESLRDVLIYIQKDDFKWHSKEYVSDYFKERGLAYSEEEDIDALSYCIADEIDAREHSNLRAKVELKINKKTLEQLVMLGDESWKEEVNELDQLTEQLKEVCMSIYDALKNKSIRVSYMRSGTVPDEIFKGNLYYYSKPGKKKNKVRFGICGERYNLWFHKPETTYGFDVQIIEKEKTFFRKHSVEVSIITPKLYRQTETGMKHTTLQRLVSSLKYNIQINSPEAQNIKEYIQTILKFPRILSKGRLSNKKRIRTEVNDLLSELKEINEEDDKVNQG
ncbi:hypothetical protein HOK51_05100 [Candidatus Woesearchaeota archaeon]|nr:hypothetical protein [Candidatus Woesearchaeota archaeon]MBT6519204.1 hypothetical protein [Candidatus Woesearchaeota archaeon]MBT7367780.1 hypothetical protein [Candidatus Woesearchaeota archaeon]